MDDMLFLCGALIFFTIYKRYFFPLQVTRKNDLIWKLHF